MKELLIKLDACNEAKKWAGDKSWTEIYSTCYRGDWLLWLWYKTMNKNNNEHFRLLTLVKGHCANTVRYLMKDVRSIAAVDAAIAFGEGKITKEELKLAADAADAAYAADAYAAYAAATAAYAAYAAAAADAYDAAYDAAAYAAYAAYAADDADAAYAAYAADAADADDAAADDARTKNLQLTADICRKYLPIELWNSIKQI